MFHHLTMRPIELLFVPVTPSVWPARKFTDILFAYSEIAVQERGVDILEGAGGASVSFCDHPTRASASKSVKSNLPSSTLLPVITKCNTPPSLLSTKLTRAHLLCCWPSQLKRAQHPRLKFLICTCTCHVTCSMSNTRTVTFAIFIGISEALPYYLWYRQKCFTAKIEPLRENSGDRNFKALERLSLFSQDYDVNEERGGWLCVHRALPSPSFHNELPRWSWDRDSPSLPGLLD
ncbi:uncharacterized protein LACBIDRAFT_330925 [Laccaria bicolor S238N-H82]|uniref:Predicted protein n=1 Tax=Laccaria bicolor (strain S238N-H82 / ATCC MYA-4686) TaxID=486041 RepID=B0DN70_LACBS|nr:uncharacterized protein LACBIDRAFT_330925 [Laccaria bicolor S238N-H82]EDR04091.1 predicted protein [Laccaria bicolor S238N-H82]|eukprot:XP_001885346.1 predicted protein [Laccaria bicolor S238N-H82]